MKKLFLFICFFMFSLNVNAETYYSDYGDYSDYVEDEIESSELVDVEITKFYQLYKEKYNNFFLENAPYEETGKYIKGETELVDDISLIDQNKEIEMFYEYDYYPAKNFTNITIRNSNNRRVNMKKIKFYDKKTGDIICDYSDIELNPYDIFSLPIDSGYNLATMSLEVHFMGIDNSNDNLNMKISLLTESDQIVGTTIENIIGNSKEVRIDILDFSSYDIYPILKRKKTGLFKILTDDVEYKTYYRNIYYLKEYKIPVKEYIDEYALNDKDLYKIDLDRYKYFYRYRTREKVIVKDDVVINEGINLLDLVEYSSIPIEYIEIKNNINYEEEGDYEVEFILPFTTIKQNIKVDKTLESKNNIIKELNEELDKYNFLIDKKNLEIKNIVLEEETEKNNLIEKLNECNTLNNSLNKQKQILKDESEVKKQSIVYVYMLCIIIFLLLLCRKKTTKKIV